MAYETGGNRLRLWNFLWCDWPAKISSTTWPTCGCASCAPSFLYSVRGWVLEAISGQPFHYVTLAWIHISGVTISAENMGVCNRLAWHINYHYEHLLSNRPVYMSPQDQRLGTSELVATSDAAAFSSPFDLPPEWTVLRNTTRSVLRDDLPHFFTYHHIQPKVEQLKKKATAVQRRAVQDENIALQGMVADLKEWLSTYERLLHFAATFHPHYEDYIGATQWLKSRALNCYSRFLSSLICWLSDGSVFNVSPSIDHKVTLLFT